jgi:hypothetical protein
MEMTQKSRFMTNLNNFHRATSSLMISSARFISSPFKHKKKVRSIPSAANKNPVNMGLAEAAQKRQREQQLAP